MNRKASADSLSAIRETFELFDSDHDGKVSKKDVGSMMRNLGYLSCSRELDEIMEQLDTDGSGFIEYQEFEEFALRINMVKRDSVDLDFKAAFDMMDTNGDGFLDKSELQYFMSKLGDTTAEDDANEMIRDADLDGDGKIDLKEYENHMKKQL